MRHDTHIFCYCVVGVTWKWHRNKPWCCLTPKAAFQEGKTEHNYQNRSRPRQYEEHTASKWKGCSGTNYKTFLSHLFFPVPSSSNCMDLPPGLSFLDLTILLMCPFAVALTQLCSSMGESALPAHWFYERLSTFSHQPCFGILFPDPFQKALCPRCTDQSDLWAISPGAALPTQRLWDAGQKSPLFISIGKQSTNKLGTSEGTGNQGKDIPKFCFLILSSTSFALIFLQTMAITRLVVKGPTMQLCQSSQVPESGFQVLSPTEQGCFPSPVNSSPWKETPIPTEKRSWENTESFWSMKEKGHKSEALPFPHGQSKHFIGVP